MRFSFQKIHRFIFYKNLYFISRSNIFSSENKKRMMFYFRKILTTPLMKFFPFFWVYELVLVVLSFFQVRILDLLSIFDKYFILNTPYFLVKLRTDGIFSWLSLCLTFWMVILVQSKCWPPVDVDNFIGSMLHIILHHIFVVIKHNEPF